MLTTGDRGPWAADGVLTARHDCFRQVTKGDGGRPLFEDFLLASPLLRFPVASVRRRFPGGPQISAPNPYSSLLVAAGLFLLPDAAAQRHVAYRLGFTAVVIGRPITLPPGSTHPSTTTTAPSGAALWTPAYPPTMGHGSHDPTVPPACRSHQTPRSSSTATPHGGCSMAALEAPVEAASTSSGVLAHGFNGQVPAFSGAKALSIARDGPARPRERAAHSGPPPQTAESPILRLLPDTAVARRTERACA